MCPSRVRSHSRSECSGWAVHQATLQSRDEDRGEVHLGISGFDSILLVGRYFDMKSATRPIKLFSRSELARPPKALHVHPPQAAFACVR
eukprot:1564547-Rhodomonas_salina.2